MAADRSEAGVRLALVMVVRGELDLVERAVKSAQPFVDDVVILDLDSGGDAEARLHEMGARVVAGEWSDDAAACRNAALDAADADLAFVLDPEEWVSEGGEALRAFADAGADRIGLVEIQRGRGGTGEGRHPRHLAPRLLPRGVRYAGGYREEPVLDRPTQQLDVLLACDDTETGRWRADRVRNQALLEQALAVQPGNPMLMLDLAGELKLAGRHAEAGRMYVAALELTPAADGVRHAMVCGALECFTKAGLFPQAIGLMDEQGAQWKHSPDYTFLVGDMFFEMMLLSPGLGGELVPLIEDAWQRCLELGERPDLVGSMHGRGSFLAAQNLYVLNLVLGHDAQAEAWAQRAAELRIPGPSVGRLLG